MSPAYRQPDKILNCFHVENKLSEVRISATQLTWFAIQQVHKSCIRFIYFSATPPPTYPCRPTVVHHHHPVVANDHPDQLVSSWLAHVTPASSSHLGQLMSRRDRLTLSQLASPLTWLVFSSPSYIVDLAAGAGAHLPCYGQLAMPACSVSELVLPSPVVP